MNAWIYAALLIELLIVAAIDLRTAKISNRWALLNFGMTPLLFFLFPSTYQWDWSLLILPVGFIVGGFILFLMGIMGAGDSKFLASLFLLIPFGEQWPLAEMLLYSTVVVGALLLLRTLLTKRTEVRAYLLSQHWRGLLALIKSRFSYAPVILLAFILTGGLKWF